MKKLFCILLLSVFSLVAEAGVKVITHASNSQSLSKSEVARIYLHKALSFPSGQQAVPIGQQDGSPVTKYFQSRVLDKSQSQVKAYWSKLIFTGKGTPPKKVSSDADVIALIKNNPNIIGYVSSDAVTDDVAVVAEF